MLNILNYLALNLDQEKCKTKNENIFLKNKFQSTSVLYHVSISSEKKSSGLNSSTPSSPPTTTKKTPPKPPYFTGEA